MTIKLIKPNTWPPGGYKFIQPQIPWENPMPLAGLDHITELLVTVRERNPRHKLSTDFEAARQDILEYNFKRLDSVTAARYYQTDDEIQGVKKNPSLSVEKAVAGLVATAKQIFTGSKTLIEAFGSGGHPVSKSLADVRAMTCLICPLNVDKGKTFISGVAAKLKDLIGAKESLQLKAHAEEKLHICDACGCYLPLKVWTPLVHIISNLPSEDYAKLHPQCWVRSEQTSPKAIPIRARFDNWSGYGQFSTQLALNFLDMGYELNVLETSLDNQFGGVSREITRRLTKHNQLPWEFVVYPCVIQPSQLDEIILKKPTVYFTMWESTGITSKAQRFMNRCKMMVVPSRWNKKVFEDAGVGVPIEVVPLGFDTQGFEFTPLPQNRPFVFGSAGKTNCGGIRKGFQIVVDAFREAFTDDEDVQLRLKAFEDDPAPQTYDDPRIVVLRKYVSRDELIQWFREIHCFASGSHSEGWGLMQQQAMCIGRPVIGIDFGGVMEFFNPTNGYPVEWNLRPAHGVYEGLGNWAEPVQSSMANQMRLAYEDKVLLKMKSAVSSKKAHQFTVRATAEKLIEVFKRGGYL